MLFQISKNEFKVSRFQKLRGLRRTFADDFPLHPKRYKVTKVTVLFSNFQKMNPRFQGFRSSEGYGGLLLMIFLDITRVTWLRRLRCFFKFSTTKKCQTCLQVFLGCPQGNKFIKVTKLLQFFLTNTFKVTGLRGYGDEKCLIHPRILTYLSIYCHIW